MQSNFWRKLSTRLFSPLVAILVLVLIIIVTYIPNVIRTHAIESAVTSAESTVKQYKAIRGYYTKNIIKKVLAGQEIRPHYNHKDQQNKIPLPATFIHDISKVFSDNNIISLKLYSPYPFPNRKSRKLDNFGQEAWNTLTSNPKQTFSRMETINNRETVRVALADTMVAEACVKCHNSHPDTPKTGWSLNDVRGILEVQVPIDEQLRNAAALNTTIGGIVIIALIATVSLLFFMFRKIVSSRLREVHHALVEIAEGEGDLSKRLNDEPKDEIGVIAEAFNTFMEQLSRTLTRINDQIQQLTGATANMENITKETQSGAAQQHMLTEQIATSMSEMTSSTDEVTTIASNTADRSQTTLEETRSGTKTVQENLASVEQLSQMMAKASEVVQTLESDSQNIGGVLDVIRGIAEQTNLLALNAAIEAARAGEQGRGFAVVADEVRTLASRTQESTEEINKMIEQLQSGAKNAVESMAQGSESISVSQEKANLTNEVIMSVGSAVAEIQTQNMQLSEAANAQSSIGMEINTNIENIKNVSTTTSQSSDELLQLAEEINSAVNTINRQLSKFIK
ncbi:methyl-accepting chemotaxis protein [Thalassotalea fusca]